MLLVIVYLLYDLDIIPSSISSVFPNNDSTRVTIGYEGRKRISVSVTNRENVLYYRLGLRLVLVFQIGQNSVILGLEFSIRVMKLRVRVR